jgi:beta-glucosidase
MASDRPYGSFVSEEHFKTCYDIAKEGVVLLKNEGLLPLNVSDYKTILVVGDNASRTLSNAGGSSIVKPAKEVLTIDAIRDYVGDKAEVKYARGYQAYMPGYEPDNIDQLRQEAFEAARNADVVIYVGGLNRWSYQDCEGRDRLGYELPFQQDTLISGLLETNPNTVLILHGGTSFSMPWRDKAKSIIYAMYGGSENGSVLSDVLFGVINPSGRLPFTMAEELDDYPSHSLGIYDPENKEDVVYEEGLYIGYRWMDKMGIKPMYPFGFGLTYTEFKWGQPSISSNSLRSVQEVVLPDVESELKARDSKKIKIRIPVTNIGNVRGAEVVQLYVRDVDSYLRRPNKELKRFSKLWLEPGETAYAEFELNEDDLRFFDANKHAWVSEKGKFEIMLGASSENINIILNLELK